VIAKVENRPTLIKFFKENPNPKDIKVHALAEQLKLSLML